MKHPWHFPQQALPLSMLACLAATMAQAQPSAIVPTLEWTYLIADADTVFNRSQDQVRALYVDGDGTAYLTGATTGSRYNPVFFVTAVESAGQMRWQNRYAGPRNNGAASAATSSMGEGVIVTGSTRGEGTESDFTTASYTATGETRWIARYNSPDDYFDHALAVIPNGFGAYVTGFGSAEQFHKEAITIAYDGNGYPMWTHRLGIPGTDVVGMALAASGEGGIVLAARSSLSTLVARYAGGGVLRWATPVDGYPGDLFRRYNIGSNLYGFDVLALSQDRYPAVVSTTCSEEGPSCLNYDVQVTLLGDDGSIRWTRQHDSSTPGARVHDLAVAVATDRSGGIYTLSYGSALSLARFELDGRQNWRQTFEAGCQARGLFVDPDGEAYVLAKCGTREALVAKVSAAGALSWQIRYADERFGTFSPEAFSVSGGEDVWIAGNVSDFPDSSPLRRDSEGIVLVKFAPAVISAAQPAHEIGEPLRVWPNPARSEAQVSAGYFGTPASRTLTLYDVMGRSVWSRVLTASEREVRLRTETFAPGAYTLVLRQAREIRSTGIVVAR